MIIFMCDKCNTTLTHSEMTHMVVSDEIKKNVPEANQMKKLYALDVDVTDSNYNSPEDFSEDHVIIFTCPNCGHQNLIYTKDIQDAKLDMEMEEKLSILTILKKKDLVYVIYKTNKNTPELDGCYDSLSMHLDIPHTKDYIFSSADPNQLKNLWFNRIRWHELPKNVKARAKELAP